MKEDKWLCEYCDREFDTTREAKDHEINCQNRITPVHIRGGRIQQTLGVFEGLKFGLGFGIGLFILGLILFILAGLFLGGVLNGLLNLYR